jgi:hypothetical protein
MSIEKNIADRKAAEALCNTLNELILDDYNNLPSPESRMMFWKILKASIERNLPKPPIAIQPKPQLKQPSPPPSLPSSYDRAMELADEIEELAENICSNGQDFAESVLEKTHEIIASVENGGRATDKQILALENMLEGLQKWFRD